VGEEGRAATGSDELRRNDRQVVVPPTAGVRRGVQPVVTLSLTRLDSITVERVQSVKFDGTIETPSGAGFVVGALWDRGGKGQFPPSSPIPPVVRKVDVSTLHGYDKPGGYFVALRGGLKPHCRQGYTICTAYEH
jgi:hypothetical protein